VLKSFEIRRKVCVFLPQMGSARRDGVCARCALSTKLAKTSAPRRLSACVIHQTREDVPPGGDAELRTLLVDSESSVPRSQDCLSPVSDLELGEDRRQVVGDRFRRETEPHRDRGVWHCRGE
jgi:hypothetical protein